MTETAAPTCDCPIGATHTHTAECEARWDAYTDALLAAGPAPREVVFVELVPATGYWVGVANHACADPEYVHVPAHFRDDATTADYCPGFDSDDRRMWDNLCPACRKADDEIVPF